MRALAIACALVVATDAFAEAPRLRLERLPGPRSLKMRTKRAAAVTPPEPAPLPSAQPVTAATRFEASDDAVGLVRDLRRPISARFSMGYVVDGTALTGNRTLSGSTVRVQGDAIPGSTTDPPERWRNDSFRQLRAYAVGEGTFSTRGVILPSLSTYLAAGFQISQPEREVDPDVPDSAAAERRVAAPVATWFDRTGIQFRSAWVEVKDFLDNPTYAPLRLRGGQLYVYGPWVLHMYGAIAAWEGKLAKLSVYGGSRVPDYTLVEITDKDRSGIAGASVRIDLRALKAKIPFAFGIEALQFTASGADDARATRHGMLQLDWRPRPDIALIGKARLIDQRFVNEHLQLRSRYKQVTNLVFDVTYRDDTDWRWDPSVTDPDPLQARRYLDLGPVVPQIIWSGRAGTLIKENVDVLVRGAIADDRPVAKPTNITNNGTPADPNMYRSTYSARYVELGGGFEVRLRRTVAVGFTGLTRQTKRYATISGQIADLPMSTEELPRPYSPNVGERGFTELGTSLRLSLGARRFSALAEAYGRRTRYSLVYCNGEMGPTCQDAVDTGILNEDYRIGGRVTVDAWIGQRLRLFASYELSSRFDLAPEISGFKSLRLVMEGVY